MPLKPLMDEVLSCKQEKSVRFRTGAPINLGVAQSGSAPRLGRGGPRFESLYRDQFIVEF